MREADQENCRFLSDGRLLLEYGPLCLTILVRDSRGPQSEMMLAGAQYAIQEFEQLTAWLPLVRKSIGEVSAAALCQAPAVLRVMSAAVSRLQDDSFTPMAAVAGSFSELILKKMLSLGEPEEIIVNNGGDIAFYTLQRRQFRIGIVDDIQLRRISHRLLLAGDSSLHGVATSGLGGRSLTRGIASAVTVLAVSASMADAAATDIANHTYVSHPAIKTCDAQELDYATDIAGLSVVRHLDALPPYVKRQALAQGLERAAELGRQGLIAGAFIFVQGALAVWPPDGDHFELQPL